MSKPTAQKAETIDDYIAPYSDDVRERLVQIRTLIRKLAPDAQETISYAIPAFKLSGKPLIYFAGYAKHIGLYPLPEKPSADLEAAMAPHVAGKGTLQFPNKEPLPLELIEQVVTTRMREIAS